jgi:hypothetical protein
MTRFTDRGFDAQVSGEIEETRFISGTMYVRVGTEWFRMSVWLRKATEYCRQFHNAAYEREATDLDCEVLECHLFNKYVRGDN